MWSDDQFTEEEIDNDYRRKENISILNSDVNGAFSTLELIWFMLETSQNRASVAAEALTYSLQELGRTPSRAIKQIIFARKSLLEGRIVLPENVYVHQQNTEADDADVVRPPAAPFTHLAEALDALRNTLPPFSDRQYSDLLARCPPTPATDPGPFCHLTAGDSGTSLLQIHPCQ